MGHEGSWIWVNGEPLDLENPYWNCAGSPELDTALNCGALLRTTEVAAGKDVHRMRIQDRICQESFSSLCQLHILRK